MSEISLRPDAPLDRPQRGPGRPLGQQRKPQLRLSMGYRDEQRHGAPVKTDHFLPRGDDRAVSKFMSVYGDKPRAVDIRLPGSLAGFLDIRHVAFAGGQGGEGGYLRAIGQHNFATLGYLGGPDQLTVFKKPEEKGELMQVDEIAISGADDPAARELDVYLQMVVSFGLPAVLGFGGLCQITSRGRESIDTLWETAVDIYGQIGSYAMIALRPKLILKASKMMTPLGITADVYVLDLWLPESMDEVYERLERHHALVPARGAAAAELLYGEASENEPKADAGQPDKLVTSAGAVSDDRSLSGESPSFSDLSEPEPADLEEAGSAFTPPSDVYAMPVDVAQAGTLIFPSGKNKGKTLSEIAETAEGRGYLVWAAKNWQQPEEFVEDLRLYAKGLPK